MDTYEYAPATSQKTALSTQWRILRLWFGHRIIRCLARNLCWRVRLPAWPQWCRQNHHHARDSGLNKAEQGDVLFDGVSIKNKRTDARSRLGIGLVPEDRRIFSDLTVLENLKVASHPGPGGNEWTVDRVFELFPDLKPHSARRGGYLSGGQQQMLTIGRTLFTNPRLLLLDEPSEGLAPLIVENLRQQIDALKKTGITILLAEQSIRFSLSLSNRLYVLEKGHVRFHGTPKEFSDDPSIQEKYLFV